jgi:hypothetical protein
MVERLYSGWKRDLYNKKLREGRQNILSEKREIRKEYLDEAYQPQNTIITRENLDANAIHSVGFDWGKTIEEMKECLLDED